MELKDELFCAALVTNRDQAKESLKEFVHIWFPNGKPSPELIRLMESYVYDYTSNDARAVVTAALAAYGLSTALLEHYGYSLENPQKIEE